MVEVSSAEMRMSGFKSLAKIVRSKFLISTWKACTRVRFFWNPAVDFVRSSDDEHKNSSSASIYFFLKEFANDVTFFKSIFPWKVMRKMLKGHWPITQQTVGSNVNYLVETCWMKLLYGTSFFFQNSWKSLYLAAQSRKIPRDKNKVGWLLS